MNLFDIFYYVWSTHYAATRVELITRFKFRVTARQMMMKRIRCLTFENVKRMKFKTNRRQFIVSLPRNPSFNASTNHCSRLWLRFTFAACKKIWEEFLVSFNTKHCDCFTFFLILLMQCLTGFYTHATIVSSTWCTGAPLSINYNNNSLHSKETCASHSISLFPFSFPSFFSEKKNSALRKYFSSIAMRVHRTVFSLSWYR